MTRPKVLVTGGTGLLGRALYEVQGGDPHWYFACSEDADLRSPVETDLLFSRIQPTHVIHLAARVGGLFANSADNWGFWADNARINLNVLDACRRYGVTKVVSCLSTCVFPDGARLPLGGEVLHDGPPHRSNRGYAYAKRMLEVMSDILNESTTCKCVCVAPVNLYGPHDTFDEESSHVVPALIRKAFDNSVLRVRGTGVARRQFLFAKDAAHLIVRALHHYDEPVPLVLAPPARTHEVTIAHVADAIAKLAGCERVEFDGDVGADGQERKTARCDTPDFQFTSLEDGLEQTVAWYVAMVKTRSKSSSLGSLAFGFD